LSGLLISLFHFIVVLGGGTLWLYKSSYNISNISYLNSPPLPSKLHQEIYFVINDPAIYCNFTIHISMHSYSCVCTQRDAFICVPSSYGCIDLYTYLIGKYKHKPLSSPLTTKKTYQKANKCLSNFKQILWNVKFSNHADCLCRKLVFVFTNGRMITLIIIEPSHAVVKCTDRNNKHTHHYITQQSKSQVRKSDVKKLTKLSLESPE
jgi:hypothetical protein